MTIHAPNWFYLPFFVLDFEPPFVVSLCSGWKLREQQWLLPSTTHMLLAPLSAKSTSNLFSSQESSFSKIVDWLGIFYSSVKWGNLIHRCYFRAIGLPFKIFPNWIDKLLSRAGVSSTKETQYSVQMIDTRLNCKKQVLSSSLSSNTTMSTNVTTAHRLTVNGSGGGASEITFKQMKFLISDRPTEATLDRYIQVRDLLEVTRFIFPF